MIVQMAVAPRKMLKASSKICLNPFINTDVVCRTDCSPLQVSKLSGITHLARSVFRLDNSGAELWGCLPSISETIAHMARKFISLNLAQSGTNQDLGIFP